MVLRRIRTKHLFAWFPINHHKFSTELRVLHPLFFHRKRCDRIPAMLECQIFPAASHHQSSTSLEARLYVPPLLIRWLAVTFHRKLHPAPLRKHQRLECDSMPWNATQRPPKVPGVKISLHGFFVEFPGDATYEGWNPQHQTGLFFPSFQTPFQKILGDV